MNILFFFFNLKLRHEKNISTLPKACWIPDKCQQESLKENIKHHISHILLKYVDFLKPVKSVVPPYIAHKFIELTKTKSVFLNCELIEASENSASGMISIMQRIHELSVPHARQTDKRVIERVVFGGDVLTNERAKITAQQNMQLNKCDVDKLVGLIHRPEGLHREMNFLIVSGRDVHFVLFLDFIFYCFYYWYLLEYLSHIILKKFIIIFIISDIKLPLHTIFCVKILK